MAKKALNEMTTTELKNQAKTIKTIAWFLFVMLLILICFIIYLSIKDSEIQMLIVVPIALFPIIIALASNLKRINTEIESRTKQ
jgi:uncharacterized protein YqhQ